MIDDFLKYQHQVEKRANQLQKDMLDCLYKSRERLTGKILTLQDEILKGDFNSEPLLRRKKLLEAHRQEVEKIIKEVYADIGVELQDAGEDVIRASVLKSTIILNENLSMSVVLPKLTKENVQAWFETSTVDGLLINDYLKKLEAGTVDRILSTTRQALIEGKGATATVKMLREAGVEGSAVGLEGLARTMMLSASNYAREKAAEGFRDALRGWRYLATLDSRTCLVCASQDGKFYEYDENKPPLPKHWNCRCVYIPEVKTEFQDKDGKRIAKDPEGKSTYVPEGMTYNTWLKKQLASDPAFVKDILGKARFEMFKDGKLTLNSMVAEGRIKNLSEISR